MARDVLEVEHLRADVGERMQKSALARTRQSAHDDKPQSPRQLRERVDDVPTVSLIAALELHRPPSDFLQHMRKRAAALAPTPAIHERRPLPRHLPAMRLENARDIAGDDGK